MTRSIIWANSKGSIWALAALLAAGIASSSMLWAQEVSPGATARLSSTEGGVQIVQAGQVVADPAPVNAPLFEGAQLVTAQDGKAEIQFEDGSVARVSPNSSLTIVAINPRTGAELSAESGLTYFEVPSGGSAQQMRIHFSDAVVTANTGTVLRIRLDTPPGEVAVFGGAAHLDRGNALSLDLQTGESVSLDASAPGRYKFEAKITPDSWDAWNDDRDQALNASAPQNGAANNIVGDAASSPAWNDLDANGSWYNMPGQGYVWSPYAASSSNWDPYGCGRWMWTPRWGYIWVSCENWGFMPYMCGQWSYYDSFGWGWSPSMGMGCHSGMWGAGYFGGVHIGRAPDRYRWVDRPGPKRPIGRIPTPIFVDRRAPGGGGGGGLPPRTSPIEIGGQKIQPIGRGGLHSGAVDWQGGNRTSPGGAGGSFRSPGTVYGNHQDPGSNVRPGYTQPHPGGGLSNGAGNSNIHSNQPVQIDGNRQQPRNFQQPQQLQPQQQQPRNFQQPQQQQQRDFQQQPRVNQPQQQPQPQHNFQPAPQPQHNFQPAPQPSFHPSGGGGSAPSGGGNSGGGGVHPSGGGNGGGHK